MNARAALLAAIEANLEVKPGGNAQAVVTAIFDLIEGRIWLDTAQNISVPDVPGA